MCVCVCVCVSKRTRANDRERMELVELYDAACSHFLLCLCSLFRRNFLLNVESEEDRRERDEQ